MAKLVDEFIRYIQYERRYSSHTVSAYKKDLCQFQQFLLEEYGIDEFDKASAETARDWVSALRMNGEKPRSVNRKISVLHTFSKFCRRNGIRMGFADKINTLKSPKNLPAFFKKSEMDAALDINEDSDDGFPSLRDNLVMEILYQTGIRRSELISLRDEDFNFFSLTLRIWGKGNKERLIPISVFLKSKVSEYIELRNELFGKTSTLIVTDKGNSAYPNLIYRIVRNRMEGIGLRGKRSPHVIRHTFATEMLNAGADLDAVRSLLGHANLAATQVYTHTSFDRMKSVYKKALPRK